MDPDAGLLDALRAGDEVAFATLVGLYHARLLRFAESLVRSRAVAEEVVQDTWLGVVRGVDAFEGRSSVKTWLFRILANRARTTGAHEARSVPVGDDDPLDGRFGVLGHWRTPPPEWPDAVESRIVADELASLIRESLPQVPAAQRQVVVLRDIEGLDAPEVCELLGISPENQRVLLHRGRTRVRQLVEMQMGAV